MTAHAQLIFENILLLANISRQFTQHIKVASWVKMGAGGGGGGRTGSAKQKTLKNSLALYEKEDFR